VPRALRAAALLWLLSLFAMEAGASQIANDSFAYPVGPLPGNNGGSGWGGFWNGDAGVAIQPGAGLSHALGLPSSGRLIGGGFNANRSLAAAISATTFWASFQIRSDAGNDQVWLGFDVAATSLPMIAFGRRLNTYFIQNGSNPAVSFCCASGSGVTDLLIARVVRGGASTTVDLWVNKLPTGAPNLTSVFGGIPAPSVVNTQVQPGLVADEIWIGTTPADVAASATTHVPVPPWAIWLLGLLLLAVAQRAVRGSRSRALARVKS